MPNHALLQQQGMQKVLWGMEKQLASRPSSGKLAGPRKVTNGSEIVSTSKITYFAFIPGLLLESIPE